VRRCECCGRGFSMSHEIRTLIADRPMTAREIAKETGFRLAAVRNLLAKMPAKITPCGRKKESQRKTSYQWRLSA